MSRTIGGKAAEVPVSCGGKVSAVLGVLLHLVQRRVGQQPVDNRTPGREVRGLCNSPVGPRPKHRTAMPPVRRQPDRPGDGLTELGAEEVPVGTAKGADPHPHTPVTEARGWGGQTGRDGGGAVSRVCSVGLPGVVTDAGPCTRARIPGDSARELPPGSRPIAKTRGGLGARGGGGFERLGIVDQPKGRHFVVLRNALRQTARVERGERGKRVCGPPQAQQRLGTHAHRVGSGGARRETDVPVVRGHRQLERARVVAVARTRNVRQVSERDQKLGRVRRHRLRREQAAQPVHKGRSTHRRQVDTIRQEVRPRACRRRFHRLESWGGRHWGGLSHFAQRSFKTKQQPGLLPPAHSRPQSASFTEDTSF
eukprot:scaffold13741_cov96-Isochrysis_galbana.AAC.2